MRNYNKGLIGYFLQLICVFLLAGYMLVMGEWQVQSNLLSLLPESRDEMLLNKAEQALFKNKERQVVVILHGEQAIAAYQDLHQQLANIPTIKNNQSALPSLANISDFYLPYKDNFLSERYLKNINDPSVMTQLITSQLIQMNNPFVSSTLAAAPRLNLADYLNTELNLLSHIDIVQGTPSVQVDNERYFISQLTLDTDGFSIKASQQVAQQLLNIFQQLESQYDVSVLYSGIVFHTAVASEQAEFEISSFGLLSLIGVVILILATFRSLKPLVLSVLTLSISVVYGLTAIVLFFDELHLLTLVFAVTLIGIVIDYCFHRFVSDDLTTDAESTSLTQNVKHSFIKPAKINKPLVLGFMTTVLGYAGLFNSPLILLSQVATFMIFGLFAGLLTVTMLLPHLKWLTTIKVMPWALTFAKHIQGYSRFFAHKRRFIYGALTVITLVSLLLAPLQFNDDVRLLNSSPQQLLANEARVAELLNYKNNQRIVITASNVETLLQRQEQVIKQLQQQPLLIIKGIAGLLPSKQQQAAYYQKINTASKQGVFDQGLANIGLKDSVNEFKALTYDEFNTSQLKSLAQLYITPFVINQGSKSLFNEQKFALWLDISAEPINQENMLWLQQQSDLSIFDKAGQISAALTTYRENLFYLLTAAFALVALVLMVKYGAKQGVMGLLPIALSVVISLLFSQYFLEQLNIFNLLALLLILALAIDYVIFYQEHGLATRTCLAILLSAISSALVFGMLALSSTPAVQSFGVTVMFGIIAIYILAPLSVRCSQTGMTQ